MSERGALLPTLDRLFAGPRDSILTIEAFLEGPGQFDCVITDESMPGASGTELIRRMRTV